MPGAAAPRGFLSKVAASEPDNEEELKHHTLAPGEDPVKPLSEQEQRLWGEFGASFRRRNNKIG
ncbi:hypothetical protein FOA52_008195 [Chlamydomonas sp. UWO 241]|nr:hypothetical protein FOA52_008195 [Chlamydomonas sp. UWO 241]